MIANIILATLGSLAVVGVAMVLVWLAVIGALWVFLLRHL